MPSENLTVCLVPATADGGHPGLARLRYTAGDPWTVVLDVDGRTLHLDRATLLAGLDRVAGHPDGVLIWPAQRGSGRAVIITAPTADGTFTFTITLARSGIDAFLAATGLMVAPGSEPDAVALDIELTRILGD